MLGVFDGAFGVFNDEIDNVDASFTAFIVDLKARIEFSVILGNVELFTGLVQNYTDIIQPSLEDAQNSVTNITNLLTEIQTSCAPTPTLCEDFISELQALLAEGIYSVNVPSLPGGIQTSLQELSGVLRDLDDGISNVDLSGVLTDLKDQINTIRQQFVDLLSQVEDTQASFFRRDVEIPASITDYFQYIHIGVVALGGVMAALLTLILVGVTCGWCSRQGSARARAGAGSVCCSFSIFFILAAILFVFCAALLLVGGISEKAVCQSLKNPEDSQVFELAENILQDTFFDDLFNGTYNLSVSELINGIHNNTPLYPLLHLDVIYDVRDLENWQVDFGISELVEDVKMSINSTLESIVNLKGDIPVDSITTAAAEIDNLLNPVIPDIINADVGLIDDTVILIDDLLEQAIPAALEASLQNMKTELTNLKSSITSVQESFNLILDNPFAQKEKLILEIFANQTFTLVDQAFTEIPSSVTVFVDSTVDGLISTVDTQIPLIVSSIENDIGRTAILSNIYNATYTYLCLDIVAPVNSVWSGLGFFLLLLLFPLLFLSCSLIKIFRTDLSEVVSKPYYL